MGNMRDELAELLRVDLSGSEGDPAEEMAEYLISQGVVLMPISVGTPIYFPYEVNGGEGFVDTGKVQSVAVCEDGIWFRAIYENLSSFWHKESDISKEVFLTRKDAENMLKQQIKKGKQDND